MNDHYPLTDKNYSSLLDSITSITNLMEKNSTNLKLKVSKLRPKLSRQRKSRNRNSRQPRSIAKKSKNSINKTSKSRGRKSDSEN